jgi:hypothetical protein
MSSLLFQHEGKSLTSELCRVVIFLSVISACIPRIHHFLYNLQSGQIGAMIPECDLATHPNDKSRSTGQSNSPNNTSNKSPNPFKSKKSSLFSVLPKGPNKKSNSDSQSSLFHQSQNFNHKESHDAVTDASAVTTEEMPGPALRFRPPSEPVNIYSMRCFSDASGTGDGDVTDRQHQDREDELPNNVVYETREFQIEYPKKGRSIE